MPYSRINIGDVFASPIYGSDICYLVTDKADGMIEVMSSYQHPSLPKTMWKKSEDRIFNRRIEEGSKIDK